jgi:retinol dehydrogenase 12
LQKTPGVDAANIETMQLDLADLDSVRDFADAFQKKNLPLHFLINNAGIMNTPYGKTKQGFEQQFGVNHLAHFLLTDLLLPKLKSSAPARIVNVSSEGHRMDPNSIQTIYDDVNMEKGYSGFRAYSRSKLSNVLFANALNRKLSGTGVTAYSLHPGVIYTTLYQHTTGGSVFGVLGRPFMKNVQQGAATSVFCATFPNLEGGKYYQDCHEAAPNAKALDVKIQDDLWNISRKLLGLTEEK